MNTILYEVESQFTDDHNIDEPKVKQMSVKKSKSLISKGKKLQRESKISLKGRNSQNKGRISFSDQKSKTKSLINEVSKTLEQPFQTSFTNPNEIQQTNSNFAVSENVVSNEQMLENSWMSDLFSSFNSEEMIDLSKIDLFQELL